MRFGRGDTLEGEQSSPCSAPWWRDAFQLVEEVELIAGSHRVNEIERALPGISRSLLASRLRHLHDAGVVERLPGAQSKVPEYHLSEAGRELTSVIEALGAWGVRWAFDDPQPEELDAGLLVWKVHQRINHERVQPCG